MNKINPNCDSQRCIKEHGEVRVLPIEGSSNVILCKHCFEYEMRWRHGRNKDLSYSCRFDIPKWENLKVYKTE